ncbi:MAG: FkbM family methyltransferase [Methylocystis sp.]|uniref:FkbM family methyltransferase n=1 Tax=Phenylobacterium sp. TaxID=1871053 RepID=UPI0025F0FF51|nr:FkbM family methyltransferase [Phenylobacterium sp.]MCA3585181.1 FkbM family methyltransferase [Methylocystis sp.]MCA6346666.1 FkbM family methyltransferase [Phenylobacterium sp.]MCA6349262.1 FkbM family methyltransferase [Phenylobacterium sp.]MCA6352224.1 FkbM family methyltransferase [Phenylobacterium sp.]MCA6355577.1 FkbM family methyltransferase [Phenylobacterium sp.]
MTDPTPPTRHGANRRQLREIAICGLFIDDESVVVDVGANIGLYTRAFCRSAARCFAFEPHPEAFAALVRDSPANCIPHNLALSNRDGLAELNTPASGAGLHTELSSLEKRTPEAFRGMLDLPPEYAVRTETVRVARLDTVFDGATLDLIKLDVEGHELEVLEGAGETLRRCRPAVYVELEDIHRAGTRQRVTEHLLDGGYRGYFVEGGKLSPIARFQAQRHQVMSDYDSYVRNFLFLP